MNQTQESLLRSVELDPRHLNEIARSSLGDCLVTGKLDVAEAILEAGIKPRPLAMVNSMRDKKVDAVKLLLRYPGADVNATDYSGSTAILYAVFQKEIELVRALHAYGARLDVVSDKGWSPLSRACRQGERPMVDLLLKLGADIRFDGEGKNLAALALAGDNPDLVKHLLEQGADPNSPVERARETSILMRSVYSEQPAIRALLLEHGAEDRPNAGGWTAAMVAHDLFKPFPEAQAALPLKGAAPDTRFHQAAAEGDVKKLRALIEAAKADGDLEMKLNALNRFGTTPLFLAGLKNKDEAATLLLDEGALPGVATSSGQSAVTVSLSNPKRLKRLLEAGAPANEVEGNSTALVIAISGGNKAAWNALLAAGASASSKQATNTALQLATKKREYALMKTLLKGDAALDEQEAEGMTALHLAVANDDAKAVALLLKAGASSTLRDSKGYTALGKAFGTTKIAAAKALLDGGASYYTPQISAAVDTSYSAQTMYVFKPKDLRPLLVPRATEVAKKGNATVEDLEILFAAGEEALATKALEQLEDEAALQVLPFVLREMPLAGEALVDKGVTLAPHTMLVEVARSGSVRLIQARLDAGDDPNTVLGGWSNRSPLSEAVASGNVDAVRLLLDAGADPNGFLGTGSPLMLAARAGWETEMVKVLVDAGADTTDRVSGKTAKQHAEAAQAAVAAKEKKAADAAKKEALQKQIDTIEGFLQAMDESELPGVLALLGKKKHKGAEAKKVLAKLHAVLKDNVSKPGHGELNTEFTKRVTKDAKAHEHLGDCLTWSAGNDTANKALLALLKAFLKKAEADALKEGMTKFLEYSRSGGRSAWKIRMAVLEWQLATKIAVGDGLAYSPFPEEMSKKMAALSPLGIVAPDKKTDAKREFVEYVGDKKKSAALSYATRYFLRWAAGLPEVPHDDGDCQQNIRGGSSEYRLVKNKLVVEWGWMETYQVHLVVEAKMKPFTTGMLYSVDHAGPFDYLNSRGSLGKFLEQLSK